MHSLIESHRQLKDSLDFTVRIDWRQVLKVVIQDLRDKRNSPSNKDRESLDKVLMYYLGEEDFEKYITNNKEID